MPTSIIYVSFKSPIIGGSNPTRPSSVGFALDVADRRVSGVFLSDILMSPTQTIRHAVFSDRSFQSTA